MRAIVDTLQLATGPGPQLWTGHAVDSSNVVVYAGVGESGGECVGLFRGGAPAAFGSLGVAPRLGTPLYGLYSGLESIGGTMPNFAEIASQPEAVEAWLAQNEATAAVIIPAEPQDFPMELPALLKVQVALHEGFHVEVQGPRWMGHPSQWPEWEGQPDRAALRSCYSGSTELEAHFAAEREALFGLVQSLIDEDLAQACVAGRDFVERHRTRMEAVTGTRIAMSDDSPGTCGEAEAMMELEEGVADYVSWVRLYELGLASRAQLERRYQAQQRDVFYLTGAMKMHALAVLEGSPSDVSRTIVDADDVGSGSLQSLLEGALLRACPAG